MTEQLPAPYKNYEVASAIPKSDALICSKYMASLKENKILTIGITRVKKTKERNEHGELVTVHKAEIYPSEIYELIGGDKNSLYKELTLIAANMHGRSILLEDNEGGFESRSSIPKAKYEQGVFTIYFDTDFLPMVNVSKNYTPLTMSVLTYLSSNASFRLYELLKQKLYKIKKTGQPSVKVRYDIYEFRFLIGLANIEEEGVKRVIDRWKEEGKSIDWEYLYEKVCIEKKYKVYTKLRLDVIIPAQKELKEVSDIRFEFEAIMGKYNKVRFIEFEVFPNTPSEAIIYQSDIVRKVNAYTGDDFEVEDGLEVVADYENDGQTNQPDYRFVDTKAISGQVEYPEVMFPSLYKDFVGHNGITNQDINVLLQRSGYNEEKIRRAFAYVDKLPNVRNYMGYLSDFVEKEYGEPVEVVEGSAEKATAYKEIHTEAHSDDVKERVWQKMTEREDFVLFEQSTGITKEMLEIAYPDIQERITMFTDWVLSNKKRI